MSPLCGVASSADAIENCRGCKRGIICVQAAMNKNTTLIAQETAVINARQEFVREGHLDLQHLGSRAACQQLCVARDCCIGCVRIRLLANRNAAGDWHAADL
eukprot:SAG31_NODE_8567_length_1428_cov_25.999345_2_plen_102_part_00